MNTPNTPVRVDDPSQPHIVVPIPREGGDITLNVKTILFALALFAGGGIGGGSLSFFSGHNDAVTKESVDELKTQLSQMQNQLAQVNNTVLELAGELKNDAVVHKRTDDELSDHEQRIRALERKGR
jgi:TolA-binding protein